MHAGVTERLSTSSVGQLLVRKGPHRACFSSWNLRSSGCIFLALFSARSACRDSMVVCTAATYESTAMCVGGGEVIQQWLVGLHGQHGSNAPLNSQPVQHSHHSYIDGRAVAMLLSLAAAAHNSKAPAALVPSHAVLLLLALLWVQVPAPPLTSSVSTPFNSVTTTAGTEVAAATG